jgi:hypothetical protein
MCRMSNEVHEILSRSLEGFRRIVGMSERFGEEGRGSLMVIDDVRGD